MLFLTRVFDLELLEYSFFVSGVPFKRHGSRLTLGFFGIFSAYGFVADSSGGILF